MKAWLQAHGQGQKARAHNDNLIQAMGYFMPLIENRGGRLQWTGPAHAAANRIMSGPLSYRGKGIAKTQTDIAKEQRNYLRAYWHLSPAEEKWVSRLGLSSSSDNEISSLIRANWKASVEHVLNPGVKLNIVDLTNTRNIRKDYIIQEMVIGYRQLANIRKHLKSQEGYKDQLPHKQDPKWLHVQMTLLKSHIQPEAYYPGQSRIIPSQDTLFKVLEYATP
eukprot:GHVN01021149.1.p1 GENE.GHVN01021149.1~~GHVN01021149.1.p1  ORF type:complete len:221 (-),score=21.60 GHVN01021149.1:185-847(-)